MAKKNFLKDTNFRRAKNCANCEFGGGDDIFPCEKQKEAGRKNYNTDCHCVCDLWVSNDRKERDEARAKENPDYKPGPMAGVLSKTVEAV